MDVSFHKPTHDDAVHIAQYMRQADVNEIKASSGVEPLEALVRGLELSDYTTVAKFNGVPAAIFGLSIVDELTKTGVPWLLGTDLVRQYSKSFLERSHETVYDMEQICPNLFNYVHCKNTLSIRWLKWLGFSLRSPEPYGVKGEMFQRFEKGDVNV